MPVLGWVLLIAGLLAGLTVLLLCRVLNRRDQVHKPHETIYGVGFKRALLIYQPSNRGGNRLRPRHWPRRWRRQATPSR